MPKAVREGSPQQPVGPQWACPWPGGSLEGYWDSWRDTGIPGRILGLLEGCWDYWRDAGGLSTPKAWAGTQVCLPYVVQGAGSGSSCIHSWLDFVTLEVFPNLKDSRMNISEEPGAPQSPWFVPPQCRVGTAPIPAPNPPSPELLRGEPELVLTQILLLFGVWLPEKPS